MELRAWRKPLSSYINRPIAYVAGETNRLESLDWALIPRLGVNP